MFDVVGAIHSVHKELGPGLNEYCYQEGFQMELEEQGIHTNENYHSTHLIVVNSCQQNTV